MFEAKLDLGKVTANLSPEHSKLFGIERTFYPTAEHTRIVREALAQQGYADPDSYLLRGGFYSKPDFDLLVKKGTDYFGRSRNNGHRRYSPNGIFVSTISDIGNEDSRLDPLWTALRSWNNLHVLAVYDAAQLRVVRGNYREYEFKNPRKKLQALLGVFHLKFTS